MKKFHKESFDKISEDKRQRILKVGIAEFSKKGLSATNINVVAKKAGISIGSLYNYFASKEDLYMAIADEGYRILEKVFSSIDLSTGDMFDKLEKLVRAAIEYSRRYPELTQIYLDLSTESRSRLSERLSKKIEEISSNYYQYLIGESKKAGLIDQNIDDRIASFCFDNLILILQYSYSSKYFIERMKIFVGEDALKDDERVIKGVMRFIRGAFSAAGAPPGARG